MPKALFTINPELTAIALAYRNKKMIAEEVMPRVSVGTQEFKYTVHNADEPFTLPETLVGRTGKVGQVEFTASDATAACEDHGLEDVVPLVDIENAKKNNFDPMGRATEGVTDYIMLRREKRVADLVTNAALYPAGNKLTLSGTDQWTDQTDSDPIKNILDAIDAMWMAANTITMNKAVWRALRTHPDVVKATNGNSGDTGIAARQAVAELFEVDRILVGEAKINTAKKGQTATLGELWGNHVALSYQDPNVTPKNGVSFGYTAEFSAKQTWSKFDDSVGLRGANVIKTGESLKELICAANCGYLLTNAV